MKRTKPTELDLTTEGSASTQAGLIPGSRHQHEMVLVEIDNHKPDTGMYLTMLI